MYAAYSMFDAPPQNTCTMRRIRSNTPLQGLAMLNDIATIEASQALATFLVKKVPQDTDARLRLAVQRCLSRDPQAQESLALKQFLELQQSRLREDLATAKQIAGLEDCENLDSPAIVELASWTLLSRVLLNLDETMSKE
jgi:hypothetical protein